MTSVLIVDDEELFRGGLRLVLEARPGIDVVGEASNGLQALHLRCPQRRRPEPEPGTVQTGSAPPPRRSTKDESARAQALSRDAAIPLAVSLRAIAREMGRPVSISSHRYWPSGLDSKNVYPKAFEYRRSIEL